MGEEEWEVSRVLAGRPTPGRELGLPGGPTPLEAGLYHAVNLRKVCLGIRYAHFLAPCVQGVAS